MLRTAFPDLHVTVDEVVAQGDVVAARGTMSVTNTGSFLGRAPTGRRANFWGVHFFRFRGDRISACWVGIDMLGLLIQLGIVPSPWGPSET
jgi:predicted ester cyclase